MNNTEDQFLKKITGIVEINLHNEQFGVIELAHQMGMSRASLHRKLTRNAGVSVSQFILQVRLKRAFELLKQNEFTASEVAYQCGFNSPSYFSKCFHDFYGYPPGGVKNHDLHETIERSETEIPELKPAGNKKWKKIVIALAIALIATIITSEVFFFRPFVKEKNSTEQTIAILPFVNDSGEEFAPFTEWMGIEIGNKLGKIENMLVVPQSTTESYRESKKSNRDIARELMVEHILRGRTIKTGNKILLNIELLEAKTGQSIFTEIYERNLDETEEAGLNRIFEICGDVVLQISEALKTELTYEEKKQVAQKSTQNPEALQYFLQGNQLFLMLKTAPNKYINPNRYIYINEAKKTFEKCINLDSTYSDAYVRIANIYGDFLYPHTSDIKLRYLYKDSSMMFIDKALHFNKNHIEANACKKGYLISKGLYEEAEKLAPIADKQVKNAGYYMTKAMGYYELQDFYHFFETISKYYELKPVSEIIMPFLFNIELVCYNATGFPELSRKKNTEWLAIMNDTALYDNFNVLIEIRDGNYQRALELTESGLNKYPNSIEFMFHELVIRNYLREYDKALKVMIQLEKETEKRGIPPYAASYIHGFTYLKNGMTEKANPFFEGAVKNFEEQIKYTSWEARLYYSHFSLAKIYAALNNKQQSMYYLGLMKKAASTPKLFICDLKNDPMFDNVRSEPEFQKITLELEKKYLEEHKKIKKLLISKGIQPF